MTERQLLVCLVAVWQLSGCGESPPVHYYTLRTIVPAATSVAKQVPDQIKIRLEPVAIPAELDRLQIVSREGPYSVRVSDSDRWAAPLHEQIRRTLSDDLSARMPAGLMVDPNEPATSEARRLLSISIASFSSNEHCEAALRADWTLRRPSGDSEHGQQQVQIAASATCPGAVPEGMSAALAQLADQLAAVLSDSATGSAAPSR